jgi:plastocyanin
MAKSYIYTDNDYETLETKARSEMVTSKLDHNITFMIDMKNKVFIPFVNIQLGDYVSFIHKGKTYESVITGITFKDSMNFATITLGEYRVKLTEKIQLLSKNTSSGTTSNITITNSDVDGGEF